MIKNTIMRHHRYIPLLAWMLIIFLLSGEVADTSSGRSDAIVDVLTSSLNISWSEELLTFLTRKAAHILAYFILGLLIFNVIRTYRLPIHRTIVISITLACVYAITDEIHQLFVPGRSGEIRDVLIDTSASAIGVLAYYYFSHKIRKNRVNSKNKL